MQLHFLIRDENLSYEVGIGKWEVSTKNLVHLPSQKHYYTRKMVPITGRARSFLLF